MRHRLAPCFILVLIGALFVIPAQEQDALAQDEEEALVADISDHLIAITTAFVGTTVVLFGTSDGQGDIAVTVIGPREEQVVRRKERIGAIWVNRDQLTFTNVPAYYAIASTRPLRLIASRDVLARLELGPDYLQLHPVEADEREDSEVQAFRDALIRNKQRQRLYSPEPGVVRFLGPRLFRTSIDFPANVPPGIYQVQVYELEEGDVVDAQRSTLVISKIGVEADIFDFAQNQAALYGLAAVVISIASGWLAGVMFRRG